MKKSKKRFCAAILAALTLFTTVFPGMTNVKAASPSSNLKLWYASSKEHGVVTEFNSYTYTGNIMYGMLDGSTAYCMNYAKSADGGQKMQSSSTPKTVMSTEQQKQLGYCMHYGHSRTTEGAPTNAERNGFVATQAMVWIIEKGLFGTDKADSAAQKLCACAPSSTDAYGFYVSLRDNITKAMNAIIPSFASATENEATVYELKWNESNGRFETTLSDTNGTISGFDFSGSGLGTSKNGNQLTIYTESVNTEPTLVTGATNNGVVQLAESCVYWSVDKEKYQEFVSSRPEVEPFYAYFKVKTDSLGYAELVKTDKDTGIPLANATFGIYSDSACLNQVDKLSTDSNGMARTKALIAGTYYVKELQAPKGYVLSKDVHTLIVKAGHTTHLDVVDREQHGTITIYKEGEVLSEWDGTHFVYDKKKLSGATFKVTAGEDIYRADGRKVHAKGEVIAEQLTTGTDGYVVLSDLHLGTYVVTEINGIKGYATNTTPHVVHIEYKDQNVEVQYEEATIYNTRQKAEVCVTKKDVDTQNSLKGGQYTLYALDDIVNDAGKVIVSKGEALQTVTTDQDGKGRFTVDIPIENGYYVCETLAPQGYIRNSNDVYKFSFNYFSEAEEKAVFEYTFLNERVTASIYLSKVDADTEKAVPQGDATLKGAEYGLYARNDILHPDGKTGVLFRANDLVATLITDEEGKDEIHNLYLGEYYVKELSPSEGYVLDETEYDVTCNYEGDLVAEVKRSVVVYEQVIRQPFQLIKISDNGKETNAPLVEGAGFKAYLKSKLPTKKDGSYDFTCATPIVIGAGGETELFTDEKGSILSIAIPYGTYVVIESATPHNMAPVKPFEITVSEHKPQEPQVWRVLIDREFTAKLRIVKKDSDTGKRVLVPNAEFKIYDTENKEYISMTTTYPSKVTHTSFFTDQDGDLILPNTLKVGNYRIEEVAAPYGYVTNKKYIDVSVDTNTFYEIDSETNEAIITVEYENAPVRGRLIIKKMGEILCGFERKEFVYKEEALPDVKFELYAEEDIYTADMQLDASGNRTKYYEKGELIATVITDKDGLAAVTDLPLGSYRLVEVKAPYGYVAEKEGKIVVFQYKDDKTAVVEETVVVHNQRQKLRISIDKKDADTKEAIQGAVFELYAKEDIVTRSGRVVLVANSKIEQGITDKEGKLVFLSDLPLGQYYVKEIEAPKGYVKSEEVFDVNAISQDSSISLLEFQTEFVNYPEIIQSPKTNDQANSLLWGSYGIVALGVCVGTWIHLWKRKKSM